ncbi:MAG: hypothetical protein J6V73_08280, partial [Spirochaetaceae bacterium]|nr:hypothetical protein [Spirochaetaceae bacterium]
MKLKVYIAFVAAVFVAVPLCAQELGDKIQKELTVNGEKVTRMVKYTGFAEHDSNGKQIHFKRSDGFEKWTEYDSNGNKIHSKRSDGYEFWYEYDENGNMIHYHSKHYEDYLKKFFYTDTWYEYDENGNRTHELNSPGSECWRKYDSKGNLIYYKQDYGYVKYEYEYEHQYNSQGNIIYTKINTGKELWYEYEYYPDGKIKTEKRFEL